MEAVEFGLGEEDVFGFCVEAVEVGCVEGVELGPDAAVDVELGVDEGESGSGVAEDEGEVVGVCDGVGAGETDGLGFEVVPGG